MFSFLFVLYPEVKLLDPVSMLKLLKIARQFSKVAESFFIPTSSVGEFQLLYYLTYTCCYLTF